MDDFSAISTHYTEYTGDILKVNHISNFISTKIRLDVWAVGGGGGGNFSGKALMNRASILKGRLLSLTLALSKRS